MTDQGYKASRISLERAKLIADAAVAAGLAEAPASEAAGYTLSPKLMAKLADVGVDKLLELEVGQAQAVEAFIAERTG